MRVTHHLAHCLLSVFLGVNLVASTALPQDGFNMLARRANAPPPRVFNDTAQSVLKIGKQAASMETDFINNLLKTVTPSTATFANAIDPYWKLHNVLNDLTAQLELYDDLPSDDFPGLSDATGTALDAYGKAYTSTFTNSRFFEIVQAVYHQYFPDQNQRRQSGVKDPQTLGIEDTTILKRTVKLFRDRGYGISVQQRKRLEQIESQLDSVGSDFANAVGNIKGDTLQFTAKELDGVPADRLAKLQKDNGAIKNGMYTVNTYQDFDICYQAKNGTTRQLIYLGSDRVAPDNIDRLKQLVSLRAEQANLLGHKNYAEYVLQNTLIKSPENVESFFNNLADKLHPLNEEQYIKPLKSFKQKETGDSKFLFEWDAARFEAQAQAAASKMRKRADQRDTSEWYEAEHTVTGLLDLLGGVFNFRFTRIDPATAIPGVPANQIVWNPSVLLFAVHDVSGQCLGYAYMDLYSRKDVGGRYPAPFGASFVRADGTPNPISVAAKLLITKADSGVTLLDSDTIHGVIRVIGNVFATFASRTKYSALSTARGIPATAADVFNIVESTFEAWSSNAAFLEKLSNHYSYGSPAALKEWNSKTSNQKQPPQKLPQTPSTGGPTPLQNGHNVAFSLSQSSMAVFDQFLFTQSYPVDTKSLDLTFNYNTIGKKFKQLNQIDDLGVKDTSQWDFFYTQDTSPISAAAVYYTYSFSFAYAADLFSPFEKDPFNTAAGKKFRDIVLASGASNPDYVGLFEQYLGRKVDMSKFYATLGVHGN